MTSTLLPIIPPLDDILFNFAQSDGFWANLAIAFGTSYDVVKATQLRQQWQSRNFSQLPPIEVFSDEVLGTANGAYSISKNKIYLSASFLHTASSAAIVNVILEEIGHYVDAQINQVDSAGDEGAIFAELVQGNSLDVTTLEALRAENDQTTIIVNGETIQVEQANLTGTNGNDTITGTSGDDTISPLRGKDIIDGRSGNDLLIINYSSNTYMGTTTPYAAGIDSRIFQSGGSWNGYFIAYINSGGDYDQASFNNIERFQVIGTNANDYFEQGGYGVFDIDGGTGTDTIGFLNLSSFTTNLTIDNSGRTFTESNGNVVKNVERFNNLTTGTGNDNISFTGSFNETIATGGGNDTINAARGYDNVNGGDGNDLLIVDYSGNTYAGTTTYPAGMSSSIYQSGGAWSGSFTAYINSIGNYDGVNFSNIERFQITGTNANDYFQRGGYGIFNIDGGIGTDIIDILDLSSFTTNLTIDNSGRTFTESNGNVVKNVERFNNLTTGTGNDSISFTGSFNETIATGGGNDTINGARGQDNVNGGDGNDLLIVNYSSNTYAGTTSYPAGMSSSIGQSGGAWYGAFYAYTNNSSSNNDRVNFSNIERFQITGTNANDTITTGGGNDIITGVNPNSSTPGKGEVDSLTGGAGSDKFILGDVNWIGYDDGNTTNAGTSDYATIAYFNTTDDTIQLQGSSSDYLLTVSGSNTNLYINKPGSEPDELIAILRNRTGLSLTASYFSYVSSPTLPSITLAVSPSPGSVTEDGTTNLLYIFTRSGSTTNPLTVNYTLGGTATLNTDYTRTGTTNTVTFAAGSAFATLTVDPTPDTIVESNETVILTLASGTGYTVGTPNAVTGTITNDDTSVTLAVSPGSVTEDGTTNLVYTFTRSGVTTNSLTVNYTLGGTATLNTDYTRTGTTNTVTFAAGSSTATVTVDPTADTIVESNKTVILTLASGTGYTVGTPNAVTGTINNDDFSQLSINDITVVEGKDNNAILTVTVDNPNPQPITFNYTTAPIDATANVDYTSKTGTITIAPNTSTATISIPILNDNLNEPDEAFTVTLSNPVNATINPEGGIGEVIITDTWQSSLTRTLPNNVENLRLIGSNNINGTGNASNNNITGNSGINQINGGAGIDTLTGCLGADIFIFQFGQSTISTSDHITDFAINSDKIDLLTQAGNATSAPSNFSRAANSTVTTLQNLINQVFTDANGATIGNQGLAVNSAALVQVTTGAIAGTYLVINDSTAGFQSSNDLLINITGFTGTLPALGSIPVGNFFV
ncbi:Calx-beta domain-containing protein [Microcystis aeruginosa CS-564/01]|uniref:beta strand repeat-containing protein n=1 Tax=Microcystis aeruginosa TaxID=1126 RepID=UPI002330DC19|nr:Calx-beta domain-containing protein [Microcystis aeruginosa]MDB9426967.1 Calx-beta domain-containing protein [Microcystis aeruginosa CS-564/01]